MQKHSRCLNHTEGFDIIFKWLHFNFSFILESQEPETTCLKVEGKSLGINCSQSSFAGGRGGITHFFPQTLPEKRSYAILKSTLIC